MAQAYICKGGPTGPQGIPGGQGPTGPTGPAGPGVPTGGTAGQILQKINSTNYNTKWADPTGSVQSVNGVDPDANGEVTLTAADVGATTWELLWENASPASDFAAQTIAQNLSEYDFVVVWAKQAVAIAKVDATLRTTTPLIGQIAAGNIRVRYIDSATPTGIIFADGYEGTGSTINNSILIPYKIYGIKGVQ